MTSYHTWRDTPKRSYRKPDPSEGTATMTARAAAVADALRAEDLERIKAQAVEAAREALAAFEGRRR